MVDPQLISKDEIISFYPMSVNINDSRVNPHILRAQRVLEETIGSYLYYLLCEDFNTGTGLFGSVRFQEFWDGKAYEYQGKMRYFRGGKVLLAAAAYERIVDHNDIHITRGGTVQKFTEQSDPETRQNRDSHVVGVRTDLVTYKSDAIQFLENNAAIYPEFPGNDGGKNEDLSINISRVGDPIYSVNYRTHDNKNY